MRAFIEVSGYGGILGWQDKRTSSVRASLTGRACSEIVSSPMSPQRTTSLSAFLARLR
jgi:hypothetical protein